VESGVSVVIRSSKNIYGTDLVVLIEKIRDKKRHPSSEKSDIFRSELKCSYSVTAGKIIK
jgi:hypothetical protein